MLKQVNVSDFRKLLESRGFESVPAGDHIGYRKGNFRVLITENDVVIEDTGHPRITSVFVRAKDGLSLAYEAIETAH